MDVQQIRKGPTKPVEGPCSWKVELSTSNPSHQPVQPRALISTLTSGPGVLEHVSRLPSRAVPRPS